MEEVKTFESICNLLRNRSYKLTPQRQTILQTFLENVDSHLSAEEVYMLVKHQNPEIGLATVYRTLDILAEIGILLKNDFGDGRSRYEFSRQDEHHHHHHLICLGCGSVSEFDDDLLESLEAVIIKRNHFKILDHDLKFYGYCEKCGEAP
ncbi:Fur family transcriptional regulator [Desulfosporosinus youngiae]|jgi:Fur family ferric uptake transcriptional regulator|uniref:Fe2+/Zn2+ uptake regulation protein n=1 Tax=Desulfosporosinus youngiae DSM 17734 TaxID=768710 RepID=H5XVL0_9FIRM|nr:Fur family transcriptional regulator [Desulfosporosinus youngiae]EHQ90093.1 Fe2+/Zn2+ uptake regulation protein [Desulfosporosinus youngiae DSM 17734]